MVARAWHHEGIPASFCVDKETQCHIYLDKHCQTRQPSVGARLSASE